ncbi:MAG: hypothetical protein K5683_05380 [Prevotella sp.]|nr:hypothetical protein [Prevotella sp.]
MKNFLSFFICMMTLLSCQQTRVPQQYAEASLLPKIYPDYAGVTVPVNIAPLCFELLNDADDAVTRFSSDGNELICPGLKVCPDIDEWHQLLSKSSGNTICVDIFAQKDSQWIHFKPFSIQVSADSIDPWISYRLISPSYVSYEELTICQRCLENFDESVIYDNMLCSSETSGQCINCHSYQQYNPRRMQLHARHAHGGTIIAYDDKLQKVNIASADSTSKRQLPAVYPAWHPTEKLIAYSCNNTVQSFHTVDIDKIEVYDAQSALLLYDIDSQKTTTIEDIPNEMSTFPTWSPDGRYLYYSSACFEYDTDSIDLEELTLRAHEIKYNIWRRPFNPDTRQFGSREMVFCADTLRLNDMEEGQSATLPRVSPDGRWLMFTLGEYGTFHIWHRDADLWLLDLATQQARPLSECNSTNSESYHTWSSNGRWVVFSSRRYDGVFTRPFFSHIDSMGQATKPFELPCSNPEHHLQLLKSYNVPELMHGPVDITPQTIASKLKEKTQQ